MIMLVDAYLCGDCTILILVKDREGLLKGGQVIRGQRFKDSFSVSLAKSSHTTWKIFFKVKILFKKNFKSLARSSHTTWKI